MSEELSDGALIKNSERHKGAIVLESGTYTRNGMESPIQFLGRVRAEHYAWKGRKETEARIAARNSQPPSSEQVVPDSGPNLPFLQDAVQESQVDMEAAIKSQVDRARSELAKAEQDLASTMDLVGHLQAKINRLTRAVSNGTAFLATLRSSDVPPENAN